MESLSKFFLPGALFLGVLVFGFWLSHVGKPYHGLLFNIHKLLALGAVILAVIEFVKITRSGSPEFVMGVLVIAALCVVALFVSGALLSAGKLDYVLMLTIHRIALAVLIVGLGLVMLFLKPAP